jgi:hypothetical protein
MDEALAKLLEFGPCTHVLEAHQHLARMHPIALAHVDLTNDSPFEMLDGLAVAVRTDHTGGDRCAGERGDSCPGPEPTEEQQYRRVAHQLGAADHACQWHRASLAVVSARDDATGVA